MSSIQEKNMPKTSLKHSIEPDDAALFSTAKKPDLSKYKSRFYILHQRREENRKINHEQVVEEDRVLKLPANYEAKCLRQEWDLQEITARKEAEKHNKDYDRIKALEMPADVAEKLDAAKRRKMRPDTGFASYEAMSLRQYDRLSHTIKPDFKSYEKMKELVGEDQFYPDSNTLIQGSHYPTQSSLDKLSIDVRKQMQKRDEFHRRRTFDPDAPIDFINERNRKFNNKLERFFGKYTEDIREDLERGTAI